MPVTSARFILVVIFALKSKRRNELGSSNPFQICRLNFNYSGPMDQIKGDDQAQTVLPPNDDSLQSLERTSLDSHAPPHELERVRFGANPTGQTRFQRLDVRIRQSAWQTIEPDQPRHTWHLQHSKSFAPRQPHKHVPRK